MAVQPVPPRGSFDITWFTGPVVAPRALARELVSYVPAKGSISTSELARRAQLEVNDVELAISSLVHDKLIMPAAVDVADADDDINYVLTASGQQLQQEQ